MHYDPVNHSNASSYSDPVDRVLKTVILLFFKFIASLMFRFAPTKSFILLGSAWAFRSHYLFFLLSEANFARRFVLYRITVDN